MIPQHTVSAHITSSNNCFFLLKPNVSFLTFQHINITVEVAPDEMYLGRPLGHSGWHLLTHSLPRMLHHDIFALDVPNDEFRHHEAVEFGLPQTVVSTNTQRQHKRLAVWKCTT